MKKLLLLFLFIAVSSFNAQDVPSEIKGRNFPSIESNGRGFLTEEGTILDSLQLLTQPSPLGVTVCNGTIYVTSSDGNGNNYWDKYDFDGNLISSTPQGTSTSWGYRDLAFDGTYILASDDYYIDKINPATFEVVDSIRDKGQSPHRGLAYVAGQNAIYSTNFQHGGALKLSAATGDTLKLLNVPDKAPYGIAFDPDEGYLWYSEPSRYGTFRLTRVDTTEGYFNFSYNLTDLLPDSVLSGGLEIIDNHPNFPGKKVALMTEQKHKKLYLVDITDAPEVLPATLTEVGAFGGFDDEGIITTGMVQYSGYLYAINNNDLMIYTLKDNPASPTKVKTVSIGDASKIFLYNNLLFITRKTDGVAKNFTIYKLNSPLDLEEKGTVATNHAIYDLEAHDNYLFLTQNNVTHVKVYDVSDLDNPQQINTVPLSNPGEDLAINHNRQLLFVSFFAKVGKEGIVLVDFSDINNLIRLDSLYDISASNYFKINVIDDQNILVLKNGFFNNRYNSWLTAYDYTDSTDIQFLATKNISWDTTSIDLYTLDGLSFVSTPEAGVQTFRWDSQSKLFYLGPSLAQDKPLTFVAYVPQQATFTNKSRFDPVEDYTIETYVYETNGRYVDSEPIGSEKVKVLRTRRRQKGNKVDLTIKVQPDEALQNGCSVDPAPATYIFTKGEQVTIKATQNAEDGWFFTEWSGDAYGTNPQITVVMDRDKVVQANFAKIILTVSGSQPKKYFCPDTVKPGEKNELLRLPITICASDADYWKLYKIGFRTAGTGNEASDVGAVKVYYGGSEIFNGKFYGDNGEINATFNPPIEIEAGTCISLQLTYTFPFFAEDYASDSPKSFYIETTSISAKPVNHLEGLILGKAHHDSLVFARVFTSNGGYYSKINDAANSPRNDKDTCYVCAGTYEENISPHDTTKGLIIRSFKGASETTVKAANNDEWIFYFKGKSWYVVDGFTILGSIQGSGEGTPGGILFDGARGVAKNNIITNVETGIEFNSATNASAIDNIIVSSLSRVLLRNSSSIKVMGNGFASAFRLAPAIYLENSDINDISSNTISNKYIQDVSGFRIHLKHSSRNYIEENKAPASAHEKLIYLENHSNSNEINRNENFYVEVNDNSNFNSISENKLFGVRILNSDEANRILENTISESETEGISVKGGGTSPNSAVLIRGNTVSNCFRTGIFVEDITVNLLNNNILENGSEKKSDGVLLRNAQNSFIHDNQICYNSKHGLELLNCYNTTVSHNTITNQSHGLPGAGTTAGIFLLDERKTSYSTFITNNYIARNCTGIEIVGAGNVVLNGNNISNSFCWNTGVHISNSDVSLKGNNINNNHGNGVFLENNSTAKISSNNIYGNSEYGVNNSSQNGINADGNYWGSANGPGDSGIFGSVNVSNWLAEAVSLVATCDRDTFYSAAGSKDSAVVYFQNLNNFKDVLSISISDEKKWITPVNKEEVQPEDTSGISYWVKFSIPAGTAANTISKATFTAVSKSTGDSVTGSFYIAAYSPTPTTVAINDKRRTVTFGNSTTFTASVFDQYNNKIETAVTWAASKGTIDSNGVFTAPASEGLATITASVGNISDTAFVYCTAGNLQLTRIAIKPDTALLYPYGSKQFIAEGFNQFDFPMSFNPLWHSTGGGKIDSLGLFIADTIPGTYYVIVENEDGTLKDTAVVEIQGVSKVECNKPPEKFFLTQNYPNPFNPTTTIKFGLKKTTTVKLEIFNILGQRVMTVINNRTLRAGVYSERIDFSRLSSGIYFYRLQAGKFVDVKKMVLVK